MDVYKLTNTCIEICEIFAVSVIFLLQVPSPYDNESFYEFWLKKTENASALYQGKPEVMIEEGGSDHMSFIQTHGISYIGFAFKYPKSSTASNRLFPLYHTAYDTHYNVRTNVDPGFKV